MELQSSRKAIMRFVAIVLKDIGLLQPHLATNV